MNIIDRLREEHRSGPGFPSKRLNGSERGDLLDEIDAMQKDVLALQRRAEAAEADWQAAEKARLRAFQERVWSWMARCFVRPDSTHPAQRSFRFVEEALELAQAMGTTRDDVLQLVEYVYGRPPGIVAQEIGGVMVTLSAVAGSVGLDLERCAADEIERCEANTEKIRAKDLAKPERSSLPGSPPSGDAQARTETKP